MQIFDRGAAYWGIDENFATLQENKCLFNLEHWLAR
jgi:hypothetical protein